MRPLVVLVLVIVAAVVLIFTLNRSDSSPNVPVPTIGGEDTPAAPTPPAAGGESVEAPGEDTRKATTDAPPGTGVTDTAAVEVPGDNGLYGLVMNEQNQPIAGAKVELSRDARMGQEMAMRMIVGTESGVPVRTALTDQKGSYRFTKIVPRRDYFLVVSHADYAPVQEQLVAVGARGDFQGPNVILKHGSVIEGTVMDVGKNIIPNAELFLDSAFWNGEGESSDRLVAKTDLMGHYEFKNVYAVAKQLTCKAEGYGAVTKTQVQVKGEPGERVTVDFELAVGEPIAGKVVGADGVGIEGARVVAHSNSTGQSFRGETVTIEDGTFQLLNLHPGTPYNLSCTKKGYTQAKTMRVTTGNMTVVIDMITQACVAGRVVDNAGNAVTSFHASARRLPPNQAPGIGVQTDEIGVKESFTNAADGAFQLCGLDPGTYTLLVGSNTSAPTFSDPFVITPDRSSATVVVRLAVGGTIRGRLVNPTGAPVAGAEVRTNDDTFDDDPNDPLFGGMISTNTTQRTVTSAADGSFELRFLTPEKYQLRISHPSYAQGKLRAVMVTESQPTDVGTISLAVGGTVKGQVIGPGPAPLRGAFVHLESDSSDLILDVRSDDQGRFTFTHVRPGNYTLSAMVYGTTSNDAFGVLNDIKRTATPIVVTEGGELTRELNLSGG